MQVEGSERRWVFGYGSLIWNPGFAFLQARPALLVGAHRQLCVYSTIHRGTRQDPGLVFGLLPGGSCRGLAFAVDCSDWTATVEYLRGRELQERIYRECWRQLRLEDGTRVKALVFMADAKAPMFAGKLDAAQVANRIARSSGVSGSNADYVLKTSSELARLGIRDRRLGDLVELLG